MIRRNQIIQEWLPKRAKLPILTPDEVTALAKEKDSGNIEARDELIVRNMRLIIRYAISYTLASDSPLDELLQAGTKGLERSVEKFQWEKGYAISTYASVWIRAKMLEYMKKNAYTWHHEISIDEKLNKGDGNAKKWEAKISETYHQTEVADRRNGHRPAFMQNLRSQLVTSGIVKTECEWDIFTSVFEFENIDTEDIIKKYSRSSGQIDRLQEILLRKLRKNTEIGEMVLDFIEDGRVYSTTSSFQQSSAHLQYAQ